MESVVALSILGLPGGGEILLILLIAVILFGHKRIPQLGEALGKGIRNFKRAFSKEDEPERALPQSSESQKTAQLESEASDSKPE